MKQTLICFAVVDNDVIVNFYIFMVGHAIALTQIKRDLVKGY